MQKEKKGEKGKRKELKIQQHITELHRLPKKKEINEKQSMFI